MFMLYDKAEQCTLASMAAYVDWLPQQIYMKTGKSKILVECSQRNNRIEVSYVQLLPLYAEWNEVVAGELSIEKAIM